MTAPVPAALLQRAMSAPADPSSPTLDALLQRVTPGDTSPPRSRLDHAVRWARDFGLSVFPVRRFLGEPLVKPSQATSDLKQVVALWQKHRGADIAAVPSDSGHWVLIADGIVGRTSLMMLESELGTDDEPAELGSVLSYLDCWDAFHLWFPANGKTVITSHHRLGRNLHVIGDGAYCFLPPSIGPAAIAPWKKR
jgi:hypothetical protein